MATLVTMSNPRLPGSVVGEASIRPNRVLNKVTSVQVVQDGKDMYSKSSAKSLPPLSSRPLPFRTRRRLYPPFQDSGLPGRTEARTPHSSAILKLYCGFPLQKQKPASGAGFPETLRLTWTKSRASA